MLDKLLASLGNQLAALNIQISRLFKKQSDDTQALAQSVKDLAEEVRKQKPPEVTVEPPLVNIPEIKVPEAKVTVTIPEIQIPEIKIPEIKVPKPEVTVNLPEQPAPIVNVPAPIVNIDIPKETEVKGLQGFIKQILAAVSSLASKSIHQDVDRLNPLPVLLVDVDGMPYKAKGGGGIASFSGGGAPIQGGFNLPKYDQIDYSEGSTTKVFTYKMNSATVSTITINYTDSTKATLSSIVKT